MAAVEMSFMTIPMSGAFKKGPPPKLGHFREAAEQFSVVSHKFSREETQGNSRFDSSLY